jgi:hypothetical protein
MLGGLNRLKPDEEESETNRLLSPESLDRLSTNPEESESNRLLSHESDRDESERKQSSADE